MRRQAAHRAWAAALTEPSARRAWHRSSAAIGPDEAIADELEAVARRNAVLGQLPSAIAALERAAALTTMSATRARRLLIAAEHASTIGRLDDAQTLLAAAEHHGITGLNLIRAELLRAAPMAGSSVTAPG